MQRPLLDQAHARAKALSPTLPMLPLVILSSSLWSAYMRLFIGSPPQWMHVCAHTKMHMCQVSPLTILVSRGALVQSTSP